MKGFLKRAIAFCLMFCLVIGGVQGVALAIPVFVVDPKLPTSIRQSPGYTIGRGVFACVTTPIPGGPTAGLLRLELESPILVNNPKDKFPDTSLLMFTASPPQLTKRDKNPGIFQQQITGSFGIRYRYNNVYVVGTRPPTTRVNLNSRLFVSTLGQGKKVYTIEDALVPNSIISDFNGVESDCADDSQSKEYVLTYRTIGSGLYYDIGVLDYQGKNVLDLPDGASFPIPQPPIPYDKLPTVLIPRTPQMAPRMPSPVIVP